MRPDIGLAAVPTLSPRLRGESWREGFYNRGEVPPLPGPLLHTAVEEREKKRGAIHWRKARRILSCARVFHPDGLKNA